MFPVCLVPLLAVWALHCSAPANGFVSMVPVAVKIKTHTNMKYATIAHVLHQVGPATNQSIDFDIEVLREMKDVRVTIKYHVVTMNRTAKNALISRSAELCTFLTRPAKDRFIDRILDRVKKNSRLPSRCPLQPDRYYVHDFRPKEIPIPAFLPESEFVFAEIYETGPQHDLVAEIRYHGKLLRVMDSSVVD